ncbi:Ca2+-binding EF-hand superfamily protein [Allocatelliglobosispora scoriae]|uniref:Ca2+-binding EF-hand superfamily protein n=1 Tax=Allocatelliglobosispora scoriae TaxID=643052 RepID=A0A841BMT0_9ACTN|nr:EF-hand domain-containing protein [Allocatelliglobosispora scoriae]MBB5868975.1 Ca2+-binding EF-hand superfamily protein [Allocatelliglobosispora scoriae]
MLTILQERKLDQAFGHLDVDRDGAIEWEDWIALATRITSAFGQSPTTPRGAEVVSAFEQLWQALLANLDLDGDRRIDPVEWREGMAGAFIDSPDGYLANFRPAARAVFHLADTDGDGTLRPAEFHALQRAFGTADAAIDAAFQRLDSDGSGELTVDELVVAAEEYYRGADPDAPGNWLWGPV